MNVTHANQTVVVCARNGTAAGHVDNKHRLGDGVTRQKSSTFSVVHVLPGEYPGVRRNGILVCAMPASGFDNHSIDCGSLRSRWGCRSGFGLVSRSLVRVSFQW